jgi:hypothetical protein
MPTANAYAEILVHSERANFTIDQVLREDQPFDFGNRSTSAARSCRTRSRARRS